MRRPFRGSGGGAIDWLIVGLGNPGREHAGTRHNVGFMVAEELATRWGLAGGKDRFRGRIAEGRAGEGPLGVPVSSSSPRSGRLRAPRVAVLTPQTFYNDAGRSVGPARGAFKVALERVLVVHDEIDLPFGEVRTRVGGGLAGNNGLKSIKQGLGGADFMRVRVGVGRPQSSDPEIVSAYVLGRFREDDAQVRELIERAFEHVEQAVLGVQPAAGNAAEPASERAAEREER